VVEAAQVADDRRQRGCDDRLIQRRQQQHQHQAGEDDADSGPDYRLGNRSGGIGGHRGGLEPMLVEAHRPRPHS
jgi:hypothetical protein